MVQLQKRGKTNLPPNDLIIILQGTVGMTHLGRRSKLDILACHISASRKKSEHRGYPTMFGNRGNP